MYKNKDTIDCPLLLDIKICTLSIYTCTSNFMPHSLRSWLS